MMRSDLAVYLVGAIFLILLIIDSIPAKRGWKINTAFIERLNLDFRQHVAAIGRRDLHQSIDRLG